MVTAGVVYAKAPYYILDGQVGVDLKDLPPAECIARKSVIAPEDATYIYGEKASGGAVIIETYAHQGSRQSVAPTQTKHHIASSPNKEIDSIWIVAAVALLILAFAFIGSWLNERAKEAHLAPEYVPEWQNPDGFHARCLTYWGFWFYPGILFFLSMICLLPIAWHKTNGMTDLALLISSIIPLAMLVWLIFHFRKTHLTINSKGIHGYSNEIGLDTQSKTREYNIVWKDIEKIKLTIVGSGKGSCDALAIYYDKTTVKPDLVICLRHMSTIKVIDAIRFFSALNNKPNIIRR